MTREEEKYKAATESWDKQGFKNQEQKIPYKLGFLEGFDYADQHPRKGLVDIEKVIEYMKKNSRFKYLLETDWEVLEDLRKAMEEI